jgi:hypothetical protein
MPILFSLRCRRLYSAVVGAALLMTVGCGGSSESMEAGRPYGTVERLDLVRLERHAQRAEVDFFGDLRRSQEGDEAALSRIFGYSLSFSRLDAVAATYGHVLYTSLLPWGRQYGLDGLAERIAAQPAPVRQRVRDFLYYDSTRGPDREAAEARVRDSAPELFPDDYVFGAGDSLFRKR